MCTNGGGDQRFLYHQFIGPPSQLWWKWRVTVLTIMTDLTGFTHLLAPWWWSFSSKHDDSKALIVVLYLPGWQMGKNFVPHFGSHWNDPDCTKTVDVLRGLLFTVNGVICNRTLFFLIQKMTVDIFSIFPLPPIPYFSSFHCFISVTGAWNGDSWLGSGDLSAMGEVFYPGLAGYPRYPPST